MLNIVTAAAIAAFEEQKIKKALWDSMPKELADKARIEYRNELEKSISHCREIEIARAGRPRNWLETLFGVS